MSEFLEMLLIPRGRVFEGERALLSGLEITIVTSI
jgi:hypothetical protein